MESRYQQVYEDENGNVIHHYDLASNIEYDSSNSDLNTNNVQDAITLLSKRTIKYLTDCPGYKNEFAFDEMPTFDLNISGSTDARKIERFRLANSELIRISDETTEFIQSVIDNAKPNEEIVFPVNKLFLIGTAKFGKAYAIGHHDGQYNSYVADVAPNNTNTEGDEIQFPTLDENDLSLYNKGLLTIYANDSRKVATYFFGLQIRREVHINLNGCTLRAVPQQYYQYHVVEVAIKKYGGNVRSTDPDTPAGTSIVNGIIDGGWDDIETVLGRALDVNYEHCMCLYCNAKVHIANLTLTNSRGDGCRIESMFDWHSNPEIGFNTKGYINSSTGKKVSSSGDGRWCSNLYAIEDCDYNYYKFDLVLRPLIDSGYVPLDSEYNSQTAKTVDLHTYFVDFLCNYISEKVVVAYYTDNDENSYIQDSIETVRFGDNLHIPAQAHYFRFAISIDPAIQTSSRLGRIPVTLKPCTVTWAYGSILEGCHIFGCGRDGLTVVSLPNGIIRNCNIHDCNQTGIDIEGTTYLDKRITFEGLTVSAINGNTSHDIIIKNSTLRTFKTESPYYIIEDCDIKNLQLGSQTITDIFYNISMPKRVVRDSIIRTSIEAVGAVFDNCVINATLVNAGTYAAATYGNHANHFNECVFTGPSLIPGIYEKCIFKPNHLVNGANNTTTVSNDLILGHYINAEMELSRYTFRHCKFDVNAIYAFDKGLYPPSYRKGIILDVEFCKFNITGYKDAQSYQLSGGNERTDARLLEARGSNFGHCYISRFNNNEVNVKVHGSVYGANAYGLASTAYALSFNLYGNAEICNNTFVPLNDTAPNKFIRLTLNNADSNNVHYVTVSNNIVTYNTNSGQAVFVFVQPVSDKDNVEVNIVNNVFVSTVKSVEVEDINTPSVINIIYYNSSDNKYYIWDWNSITEDGTLINVTANTLPTKDIDSTAVYYHQKVRKYYKYENDAWVEHPEYYDAIAVTDIANVVYHDKTSDKYYKWSQEVTTNNGFVEDTNYGKISDVVLITDATSVSVDYVRYAPLVQLMVSNRVISGKIIKQADPRIIELTTNN